jgi:pyruvate/2-oxoglutarate dehydrogenase complex dihydrolipoamide acyltransferase (E2) component
VSSSTTDRRTTLMDVTMPQLGVSVAEGTIIAWHVEVGDRVLADQTVCEISTDKIDSELPSPAAGIVAELLIGIDQTVPVGTVLARIATETDVVAAEEPVAEAGGPANGPSAGADGPADGPSAGAGGPADEHDAPASGASSLESRAASPEASDHRHYSPVVQRIAATHGIDLATVLGSGRGGRVRKQDVLAAVERASGDSAAVGAGVGADAVVAPEATPPGAAPLHIESPYRPEDVSPARQPPAHKAGDTTTLSRMRRQIGEHMKRSLQEAATCTTWIEADMGRVEAARAGLGVTALAFVARACVTALQQHPALNATLEGEAYTRFGRTVNLGIAVSLGDEGLIVPVIHDAQELSVEGLAARIRELARRARAGQLSPDEVRNGSFTITNPGQYGSIMATPVINQPQVAILDLEAIVKRAVVMTDADGNDSIAIRPMTILGLSWDHRALDGALSAQFLATVRRELESLGG